MKIPDGLKFVPKTLSGVLVVLVGAGITYIPAIGGVAGEAIISAGVLIIVYGVTDKFVRYKDSGDVFRNEKYIAGKVKATFRK